MLQPKHYVFLGFLTVLFISVFTLFLNIRYETNDDIIMLLISSGVITGTPNEHLVFIGVPIGLMLKYLYLNIPGFEHYTLFLLTLHAISIFILIKYIIEELDALYLKILFVALFLSFECLLIVRLQFTTTSALLSVAAFSLFKPHHFPRRLLTYILFGLACCLRLHAAMLVLIILIFYLIRMNKFQVKKSIQTISPIILIALSLEFLNYTYYKSDPKWSDYIEYNSIRGKINDNPNYYNYRPSSQKEAVNFFLLRNFLPDTDQMTIDELTQIHNDIHGASIRSKLNQILPQIFTYKLQLLTIIIITLVLCINKTNTEKTTWLVTLPIFLGICIILSMDATLKPRVFISAMLPIMLILLPFTLNKIRKNSFLPITLIFICIVNIYSFVKANNTDNSEKETYNAQIQLLNVYLEKKSNPLVLLPGSFYLEWLSPMSITNFFDNKNINIMGWLSSSPFPNQIHSHNQFIRNRFIFVKKEQLDKIIPKIILGLKLNYNLDAHHKIILENNQFAIIEIR